jgi:phenylpropionate dioxygenase-like ring-hydroxylating dioxygenase large terminal subunit
MMMIMGMETTTETILETTNKDFYFLCLLRDLPRGQYKTFQVFGYPLVAKNEGGLVTVALNKCSHRGFRVVNGSGPCEHRLRCPYHGLPFNYETKFQVRVIDEFVYFGPSDFSPNVSLPLGEEFGEHKTYVRAPFHLWVQNTADPNHLATVHRDTFSRLFKGSKPTQETIGEKDSWYSMPVQDAVVNQYKKWKDPEENFWFRQGFAHGLAFPHLSVTSFLGVFFSVETVLPCTEPRTEGTVEVRTRFFVSRSNRLPKLALKLALDANRKILDEDKAVVEEWAKSYYDHVGPSGWIGSEGRIKSYLEEFYRSGMWKRT